MQQRPLGQSGLTTAPQVFGGNVFGWTADAAMSFRLLDAFVDSGFNLIDTADVYSRWVPGHTGGESETLIGQWLAAVVNGTQRHWTTGHEIALCGRLIKGYGSTNERGKDNLLHVIKHLVPAKHFATDEARAQAIAAARQAALADEAGKALDQTLVQHGAPARPVKAQPIRWVRKPQLRQTP